MHLFCSGAQCTMYFFICVMTAIVLGANLNVLMIINMLNWSVVSLMLWEWWLEVREAKRAVYVGLLIWKIICPFDFKSLWLSSAGGEITSHCCEDWRESQSSSSCLLINQLCQRETASKRSHHYIIAQISYSQRQHQCSRCHNIL